MEIYSEPIYQRTNENTGAGPMPKCKLYTKPSLNAVQEIEKGDAGGCKCSLNADVVVSV